MARIITGPRLVSKILRKCFWLYVSAAQRIWSYLPDSFRDLKLVRAYGRGLHRLVCRHADRKPYFTTFFLRNRPELKLLCQLADRQNYDGNLNIAILACSKGAETYSIAWAIRNARPDMQLRITAVDISQEILDFARRGIYSLSGPDTDTSGYASARELSDISRNTSIDQNESMFERMTDDEMHQMFEVRGQEARVLGWLREGITWLRADATELSPGGGMSPQDIVVANRFLCHMAPADARRCLRNVARLVKPGGYLFCSGVDLDVRTEVARDLGWRPLLELIREIHDGDPSIQKGWPGEYWGLEPFDDRQPDWNIRYACAFQIGDTIEARRSPRADNYPESKRQPRRLA